MTPTTSAMSQALAGHQRESRTEENRRTLDEVKQLRSEIENMQVEGGSVKWPSVRTPAGGASTSRLNARTANINVFVDGTLEAISVYTDGSSSFGPF